MTPKKTVFYELGGLGISGKALAGSPVTFHKYHVTGGYFAYTYARTHTQTLFPETSVSEVDWDRCSFEALRTMLPRFSEGNQFFNDLLELHQIKSLLSPYGAAKGLIGKVSNTVLWYSFGVRPVVQTIIAVRSLMRTLRDKIRDLRKRAKRLQTRHYARMMDIVTSDAFEPQGEGGEDGSTVYVFTENLGEFREVSGFTQTKWVVYPKYHATLKFRYDIAAFSDLDLELRAWGEAMDLLDPVRILWNAIPFSFVLDWFTNIGDWVDQLLNEPAIPVVIEDFSHSVKYQYQTDMYLSWWRRSYCAPIAAGVVSHYERRRAIPSSYTGLDLHPPSVAAYVLGAALIGQASQRRSLPPRIRKQLPYLRFKAGTFVR